MSQIDLHPEDANFTGVLPNDDFGKQDPFSIPNQGPSKILPLGYAGDPYDHDGIASNASSFSQHGSAGLPIGSQWDVGDGNEVNEKPNDIFEVKNDEKNKTNSDFEEYFAIDESSDSTDPHKPPNPLLQSYQGKTSR